MEKNIKYETGAFYVYKVKGGYEVRQNMPAGYAIAHGAAKGLEQAKRVCDRLARYPEKAACNG